MRVEQRIEMKSSLKVLKKRTGVMVKRSEWVKVCHYILEY